MIALKSYYFGFEISFTKARSIAEQVSKDYKQQNSTNLLKYEYSN